MADQRYAFTPVRTGLRKKILVATGATVSYEATVHQPHGKPLVRSFKRLQDAKAWQDQARQELVTDTYVDPKAGAVTLVEYAGRWLRGMAGLRPRSVDAYADAINRLAVIDKPIRGLLPEDVGAMQVACIGRGLAPRTVNFTHGVLIAVLDSAVDNELIRRNVAKKKKKLPLPDTHVEVVAGETMNELIDETEARYRDLIEFMASTGLRSGEARGITEDRILRSGKLRIDRQVNRYGTGFGPPKGKPRDLSVGPETLALLDRAMERRRGPGQHGIVFQPARPTAERFAVPTVTLHGVVTRAAGRVGLYLHPHDLRHFHASWLISCGYGLTEIQERLGHADFATTARYYAHLMPHRESAMAIDAERSKWSGSGHGLLRSVV